MKEVASLTPEKRERLTNSSSFGRSWEVVNPTHHTLRFLGRRNEGALIRPITSNSLNRRNIYFILTYVCSDSAINTYPTEYDDFIHRGSTATAKRVVLTLPVDEVVNSTNGVYIEEFDIVLGNSAADLRFPKVDMPTLQLHTEETVIYQYFIAAKQPISKVVYTDILGVNTKVQVIDTGEYPPGLYTLISESAGSAAKLINPSPVYAASEKELVKLIEHEQKKVKPITHASIDVSLFNQFMSTITKQTNTETSKIDSSFDEEFKVRDIYRKDRVEEVKATRVKNNEFDKQATDAVKAMQNALGLLSKVLG